MQGALLADDARLILAAWLEGLLTEDDVRSWSYEVVEATLLPHSPSGCSTWRLMDHGLHERTIV
jgi:hypothetical protein